MMEFSIIERRDGMKCNSVIGILGMFLFAYTTNGQSLVCKSNNVGRCESRDEAAEIDRIEGSEQKWDVETVIAHASEMLLPQTNKIHYDIKATCERIAKCPDAQKRHRYFRDFMANACKVRLDKIADVVPLKEIKETDADEIWKRGSRQQLHSQALLLREREIMRLRREVCGRLTSLAERIWTCLWTESIPASGVEQFEPWFMLIEKMKTDKQYLGQMSLRSLEARVEQVEYLFNFVYLRDSRKALDPQDRAAVEARFKQVVGRPIRSAEQYEADSRRRMEENIKEHQKQQEANRRALEFQRKYNREHNINEH